MLNLLTRYRHISLFILFLFISLALLSFERPVKEALPESTNIVERGILLVLQPFQRMVGTVRTHIQEIWQHYIVLVHLSEENQRLREKISQLQAEKNRYYENALAYERLEGIQALMADRQFSTILASVIGHDPTNHSNTIIINRGSEHGVQESWPVITQDGIVGVTVGVSLKSAKVLLLTDPNCNVASLIQRTRDQGVVGGQSRKEAYIMKYVNRRSVIREGTIYQITDQALAQIAKEDIPGYVLTDETLNHLEAEYLPVDILLLLEVLKDHQYPNQKRFLKALEATLGKEQADWYKGSILQYAQAGPLAKLQALKNQQYRTEEQFLQAVETAIGEEQTHPYKTRILKHVQEQEMVISSGLGGIFPKGLIIGHVSKVIKQDYGLFQEIEVAPAVNFSKLEEVLIIQRTDMKAEP
ncbi:hypothetical protein CSA56_06690 [candidate division KSB3 bacterium]|uniref:Cell shape-determining protein MreC n=1 Tax=candidate division KSB3 bacterium TaxID=2044937 RepID=A0A2G6KGM1_9BACT|nr:MAG: hypothetical protein CSA56_06690 [candidate division KSB3 bacterium]